MNLWELLKTAIPKLPDPEWSDSPFFSVPIPEDDQIVVLNFEIERFSDIIKVWRFKSAYFQSRAMPHPATADQTPAP